MTKGTSIQGNEMTIIDKELFENIQKDYRDHSFEYIEGKYSEVDREILRQVLSAQTYDDFNQEAKTL